MWHSIVRHLLVQLKSEISQRHLQKQLALNADVLKLHVLIQNTRPNCICQVNSCFLSSITDRICSYQCFWMYSSLLSFFPRSPSIWLNTLLTWMELEHFVCWTPSRHAVWPTASNSTRPPPASCTAKFRRSLRRKPHRSTLAHLTVIYS